MAAALFERSMRQRGLVANIQSAGLLRRDAPAPEEVITILRCYEVDFSTHRSQRLVQTDITEANLIIGLERHTSVSRFCSQEGEAWNRTFTLWDLRRRGSELADTNRDHRPIRGSGNCSRRRSEKLHGASALDDFSDLIRRIG
jgi:protein-tyrosine-phosphatase